METKILEPETEEGMTREEIVGKLNDIPGIKVSGEAIKSEWEISRDYGRIEGTWENPVVVINHTPYFSDLSGTLPLYTHCEKEGIPYREVVEGLALIKQGREILTDLIERAELANENQ
jgi:hypothetical protein